LEVNQPRWTKPVVLAESANIVEYVAEHFGRNLTPDRWKKGTKMAEPESELKEETEEWMR
jgi:glutathione S-transferase